MDADGVASALREIAEVIGGPVYVAAASFSDGPRILGVSVTRDGAARYLGDAWMATGPNTSVTHPEILTFELDAPGQIRPMSPGVSE